MWFVAGVDDRSLERGLEANLLLEEIGPLTELEWRYVAAVGDLLADLPGSGVDLTGHQVRSQLVDDPGERDGPVEEVVLVTAVGVALAVGVVLVDDDLVARRQETVGGFHGAPQDQLPGTVVDDNLERVRALGSRVLRMSVVDVVAGTVGEHGVDEVGLDIRGHRALAGIATSVTTRRLVLEVPPDPAVELSDVRVDQERRRGRRADAARGVHLHPVLGLDPADLGHRHARTLPHCPEPAAAPTLVPARRFRDIVRFRPARSSVRRAPPRPGP